MIKSFKIRLYPTKDQEQLIWKHIGCCRYIWNYMLALQQQRYENSEKHLSAFDMINQLKPLKADGEHGWLYDVANTSLVTTCRDLDKAYKEFFHKTRGYPKFKSRKRDKPSFPVRHGYSIYFADDRFVQIEKLGRVRYRTDFEFAYGRNVLNFLNPRISNKNGKWLLTFGLECENQVSELTNEPLGIDLGVKDLAIAAYNGQHMVFHNINKSKRMRDLSKKERHLQRSISRKYEASRKRTGRYEKTKNIIREEALLSRICARKANIRHNYIHQITHTLASLLPARVVMEDLNVQGMMKNRHLSKAIQEQNFYEFMRQMEYKCAWRGIPFGKVPRFYPSSKTCSACGCVKKDLRLSERIFVCPECGCTIDRDYNAALNLSRYEI